MNFSQQTKQQNAAYKWQRKALISSTSAANRRIQARNLSLLTKNCVRVIPVIENLRRKLDVLISIDTSKAEVARAAIEAGASIVNDVTGGRGDDQMLPLVAETKSAFIIMHMQGTPRTMQIQPRYTDVVAEISEFFRQQYARRHRFKH